MSFKERIEQARLSQDNEGVANDNAPEDTFESECFGVESVRNLPACLDLRFLDGTRKAIPYSYILEIDYDPSGEIKITCSEKEVTIKGWNLEKLYDYLAKYRVRFVAECSETYVDQSKPHVGKIIFDF